MIMESANLHHQHHQLQENLVVGYSSSSSSSLLPSPSSSSCYALGTKHSNWTPTTTTTLSNNSGNSSSSSLDLLNTSMAPDLGFQWLTNLTTHHHSPHDLAKIKEELSASSSSTSSDHHPHNSFPKLTEMLTSTSSIDHDEYFQFIKNEENNNNNNIDNNQVMMNDLSDKLLLKTLSSSAGDHQFYSDHHHHHHHHLLSNSNLTAGVQAMMPSSRSAGHFSQIYPSINISNLNRTLSSSTLSSSTSSLDMNLQAMDLLGSNSARFGTHNHQLNSHADTLGSYIEQMHQTADRHYRLSSASNKISTFDNEVITEVKRPGSSIEPKVAQAAAPKKSRLESRTSCPPFKVRKEKLGDRIAALQQLVAPFGKTDTASVLMEAIGYIKFLQNQVETLSVPYMKMSRNKSCKTMQRGMIEMSGNGETSKRDLRSRGLCLVPLSCMSYVTGDIGGGGSGGNVWPTADFGGGI